MSAPGAGAATLLEQRVLAAVDEASIRDELLALVAVPSLTGREEAIQDEVAARMVAAGLEVDRFDGDLATLAADPGWPGMEVERARLPIVAGRLGGGRQGPTLMVLGHVDVVPVGDPATWSNPPFEPAVHDGRVVGRGACDMKGGLAAMLAAVRAVAHATDGGRALAGGIVALAVPGEEDGGAGTFAAIRAGYRADLAIIPEPTSMDIVVVHAGAITFRLTVPGRAAHASTRREGVSALDKLGVVVRVLEEDEAARSAAETRPEMCALGLPYPTIIGKVSGGAWASTVLDRIVAEGRYGVRAGQTAAEAARELEAAIARANASDRWLSEHPATVEVFGGLFSSGEVPSDHPLPVGLADVAEAVTGRRPALVGAPYGADMRLLIREAGTPTVMFGPGDVRRAHAADEDVPLADVVDCARVLAAWLLRGLAGQG